MNSPEQYTSMTGLQIVAVHPSGADITLRLEPAHRRQFPQRSGMLTLQQVSAVRSPTIPDGDGTPLQMWRPVGELAGLRETHAGAEMIVKTYGPGNVWTDTWQVECAGMRTETYLLTGPTLRAALLWLVSQWMFWLAVLLSVAALVVHGLQRR